MLSATLLHALYWRVWHLLMGAYRTRKKKLVYFLFLLINYGKIASHSALDWFHLSIWPSFLSVQSCESQLSVALNACFPSACFVQTLCLALLSACDVGSYWAEGPRGRWFIMSSRYWATQSTACWNGLILTMMDRGENTSLGKVWSAL